MLRHFFSKRRYQPDYFENSDIMIKLRKKLGDVDFEWMTLVLDEAISKSVDILQPMQELEWAGYGMFIGDSGIIPTRDVKMFMELLLKAFNDEHCPIATKTRNVAGGTMFMWRISLRPELWCSYDNENRSQRQDPVTGRVYIVYKYFIEKGATKPRQRKKK